VEGAQTCPGESACGKWAAAAGEDHATRERNACHNCDLFPTKRQGAKRQVQMLTKLVDRALQIRRERRAGYPRAFEKLGNVEYQLYLILDDMMETEEILARDRLTQVMLAGFNLKLQ
jgi:hypothetical protein